MTNQTKFIDIDSIFKNKNPLLYKWLPRFVINWIKRTVHESEVNDFIVRHGHKKEFEFVNAILERFDPAVTFTGLENVPEKGGVIIAANHPLGGLDAMALLQTLGEKRKDLKFIVNDILLQLKNLNELFVGVNKHGKNSNHIAGYIDTLYASDQCILIFPAGLVSRKQNGVIKDLEWKKSFISKSKKYNRTVIPVHIEGRNSNWFYNLALFRKKLGIKANIEMFYLVDEMFHQKGKNIHIQFGSPIPSETFTKERSDSEWAQYVKNKVYALGNLEKNELTL